MRKPECPKVLSIAGSDSGAGAGIQADLKTFAALGCYGMSVVTAVTAQNTIGITAIQQMPADIVAAQLDAVLEDIGADAAKIGMVSSQENIEAIADRLDRFRVKNIVVDTVMQAKDGAVLLPRKAQGIFVRLIFPLALVATPNIPEAEAITGRKICSVEEMKEAARYVFDKGARSVLIKGGHLDSEKCTDVFYDGRDYAIFESNRIPGKNTHGTGCTLSAAIAANLAKGMDLRESIGSAKEYVTGAIRFGLCLGNGNGPLDHFWQTKH